MTAAVPDILAKIVSRKQEQLVELRPRLATLEKTAAARTGEQRGFRRALAQAPPAIIAEIKKASPSKGVLAENFRPVDTAQAYAAGGAAAISVLTDRDFFQGSLEHLDAVRQAVAVPVIRKDFTLEEAHIVEAAAHGADAVLLIAALFRSSELQRLREFAHSLGLDALVEVHDADELARVKDSGADLIGVNNRDLRSFSVSLDTSLRLAEQMPAGAVRVSESGIFTRTDVLTLMQAGYQAFLVGEHLMKSGDPASALKELRG
ncbi:MAG: indole-3-glycerol phosphate synthase TrpC [Bryobacter sp.]